MKNRIKIKGFTLIELLVVIAVIAILVTIGLTSFSSAQKKARDARRKSDLRDIKNALEEYYSTCGFVYPTSGATFYASVICTSPSIAILPTMPDEPRNSPYYCPTPVATKCSNSVFNICTTLESETPAAYCVYNSQ